MDLFFSVEKETCLYKCQAQQPLKLQLLLRCTFCSIRIALQIAFTFQLTQSLERIHVVFLEGGNRAMQIAFLWRNKVQRDNSVWFPLHGTENFILFNPLKPELNPICYLLALLGARHFLHVSRIRVKLLTFRLLMSYIYIYIYGALILDVSRSHTTTQHSR